MILPRPGRPISIALSRGVQMLFVVALSQALFCGENAAQCLRPPASFAEARVRSRLVPPRRSPEKAASVAGVAAGIACYARGAMAREPPKR